VGGFSFAFHFIPRAFNANEGSAFLIIDKPFVENAQKVKQLFNSFKMFYQCISKK
jgi:hypothetical protein